MEISELGPFENLAKKWSEDAVTLRPSAVKSRLYHYTDAAGLFGMLNTGELWLTDYRFLNDKSEYTHAFDILKSIKTELISSKDIEKAMTEVVAKAGTVDLVSSDAVVFSLSEEKDDLSQWRGYAHDGLGFTIGFDGPAIHSLAQHDDAEFAFTKVSYDTKKEGEVYKRTFLEIHAILKQSIKNAPQDKSALIEQAIESFNLVFVNRALTSKHQSFKSENEWRLISYLMGDNEADVRVSGRNLIPYYKMKLGDTLPIKEIGIGPGFAGSEIVDAVKILARKTGYDPTIYFADTPYRRVSA